MPIDGVMKTLLWKEWRHLSDTPWRGRILISMPLIALLCGAMGIVTPIISGFVFAMGAMAGRDQGSWQGDGTSPYDILFVQPVRRRQVLTAKIVVTAGVLAVILLAWATVYVASGGGYIGQSFHELRVEVLGLEEAPVWAVVFNVATFGIAGLAAGLYAGVRHWPGVWRNFGHFALLVLVAMFVFMRVEMYVFDAMDAAIGRGTGSSQALDLILDITAPDGPTAWILPLVFLLAAAAYVAAAYRAIERLELVGP